MKARWAVVAVLFAAMVLLGGCGDCRQGRTHILNKVLYEYKGRLFQTCVRCGHYVEAQFRFNPDGLTKASERCPCSSCACVLADSVVRSVPLEARVPILVGVNCGQDDQTREVFMFEVGKCYRSDRADLLVLVRSLDTDDSAGSDIVVASTEDATGLYSSLVWDDADEWREVSLERFSAERRAYARGVEEAAREQAGREG